MSGTEHETDLGVITSCLRRMFRMARWLSLLHILGLKWRHLRSRGDLDPSEFYDKEFCSKRAVAVDLYILAWLTIDLSVMLVACTWQAGYLSKAVLMALSAVRILEIFQTTVNAVLFDGASRFAGVVGSTVRVLVLAGISFSELVVCFGSIYALNIEMLSGAGQPITGYYFSAITQLTIGYGDVYPRHWLRIIAVTQGLVGTVFVLLVFGRMIASLGALRGVFEVK